MCLGEPLARNTFYLFTTALVKQFVIKPLPDQPLPSLEPQNGLGLGYPGFRAVLRHRQ